jgi:tetratricopeptide (TPR) repeat protein
MSIVTRERYKSWLVCAALVLVVLAAYANHFENEFHFDDFHTITKNLFIQDFRNIPKFFVDPGLFSTLPDHQTYRPLVSTSLALDYWMGHSLAPFYFHLSTWCWFAVQLVLMFFLFRRIMNAAEPSPANFWTAAFAVAWYGLHPANAETINYVIQRADLYGTLGIVASLLCFAAWPAGRRTGVYLLPAVAAYLSKPPALIYPAILMLYVFLFENDGAGRAELRKKARPALRAALPALGVTVAAAVLTGKMTPPAFDAGVASASLYRLTQPWVALHYFKSFFLPTELSADSDWGYVSGALSTEAVTGYVFIAVLLWAAIAASQRRETRPICFGIAWFLLALLPTSLMPLAEVTNDHRMFFAFVGLSLAVFWSVRLLVAASPRWSRVAALAMIPLLVAAAAGTRARNEVWRTEESLWRDVTEKSPRNGRGWMNYGLIFMARGDFRTALADFERGQLYSPNYSALEINLGIANAGVGRADEALRHFQRAITLAPASSEPYFYYGRWLATSGRIAEATPQLETAVRLNPAAFDARHLLMQEYAAQNNVAALRRTAADTLRLAPGDEVASRYASGDPAAPAIPTATAGSPEALVDISLNYYRAGRYEECITAARQALASRPDFPEAYNNIAAASNALGKWEQGIQAAREALRLKPDFQLARNNLLWAVSEKDKRAVR